MASNKTDPVSFPIVAAGASAGGLEAFTALLKGLPANSGMGFVFIQHLEPTHESALAQLLSKATAMPVVEVSDGVVVKPDRVYIIPPGKGMTIRGGALRLTQREKGRTSPHHPIDEFCVALAHDQEISAIGVLLSGSGSDGTLGLQAIRAAGGITFAQEPRSAQWPIMPESAISAGAADFVMPPRRIAAELARIGRQHLPEGKEQVADGVDLDKICLLLRSTTGVDFRLYKQATVNRRVARRMTVHKLVSLAKYAEMLKQNPAEAQALADDIFIHVTGFFRDPECFQALRKQVLAKFRTKRAQGDSIRVWVPGCSTGEEVYTLAMLLIESLEENGAGAKIQMFGTDISEHSVEHARAGIYSQAAVEGVSAQRLKRFFVKDRQRYQIAKAVRDFCVFARHDLAKDPPFSRLDLVSCRNVLIYMGPALQRRTLSVFQYALKPGGFLFLGNSEAIGALSDVFAVKDRAHRIFIRKPSSAGPRFESMAGSWRASPEVAPSVATRQSPFDFQREAERILLQRYVPPSVIVDSDLHIVHFQGDTSPFLAPATGQPSFHLLKMVSPDFIVDLRNLISKARREGVMVRRDGIRHRRNGVEGKISLEVVPLRNPEAAKSDFLIIFKETINGEADQPVSLEGKPAGEGKKAGRSKPEPQAVKDLDRELVSTRDYLRSLISEHEIAQEEMKAANEEILSSNEELQSTNEELETAKEELQSSNEELVSLNDELQHRNAELGQLSSDLNNILSGVDVPVLLLDSALRIRRFTPVAEKLFNLIGTDVGRPFNQIASNLEVSDWTSMFTEVMEELQIVEREIRDQTGHWYLLRMRPYKTTENRIDGVLMALLDIDSVKKSFEEVNQSRNYADSIVETIHESLLVLDGEYRVLTANKTFYSTFKVGQEETLGRQVFKLGEQQWEIPRLRQLLEEILPRDAHIRSFPVEQEFPGIGIRKMLINARRIQGERGGPGLILLAIEDVTEKSRAAEELHRTESTVRALLDSTMQSILAVRADGTIVLTNKTAEKMFGYGPDGLAGQSIEVLIPAESRTRHTAYQKSFFKTPRARPMGVGMELEGCRKDGTRFPVEISLSHTDSAQGRLAVAFISDISERKKIEAAALQYQRDLQTLTARLIAANEDQSKYLARELHDVFSQKLAALAMDISVVQKRFPQQQGERSGPVVKELENLEKGVKSLAVGLHDMSRQLHPSILDDLGLAAALKDECLMFSQMQGIPVIFRAVKVPKTLPEDIALCLYRVAQEILRNVAKHAVAREVRFRLTGNAAEIRLYVQDIGHGFDVDKATKKKGLGLISIEERVRMVHGTFRIESQPGSGTKVEISVPISGK